MRILLAVVASVAATLAFFDTATAQYANLISCLQGIQGNPKSYLTIPSSSTYNTDRLGYNVNFNYKPSALYHPATVDDAGAAIQCAAKYNISIAPRSGGHSFEGYGQGGRDGSLVIDVNQFQQFSMDAQTGVATIGAGTRLGPLYMRLWEAGQFLVPGGTCPSVGIGGIALGGGIGMVSRKYGALTNSIVGMEMLDATGTKRHISETSNPELFWALRGAGGGSFGLVTEFQIQAYKAPSAVTTMVYKYPLASYRAAMEGFTKFGRNAPNEFFGAMSVRSNEIELRVNYLSSASIANKTVAPMLARIGVKPLSSDVQEGSWIKAAAKWSGSTNPLDDPDLSVHRYHRGGSLVYRRLLSVTEMDTIFNNLNRRPAESASAYVIFEMWGGKMDRPPRRSPAAFDRHRGVVLGLDFGITWKDPTNQTGTQCAACLEWSAQFRKELYDAYDGGPQSLEAYQNYIEFDLPNWLEAYYGNGVSRLQQIKKDVDSNNLFTFPQSIPLP
ncbi:hypothetical protein DFQ27_002070 [Actinomortierella ambigua]|uniref:FAD-binding PCMH-type domain-containing protein n=1 Tax=Actinomortierella ambigua TaxID=1343610 RepID=A0A9P6U7E3_9FUNG|nr:hypothetical protein DFQ27_002070 [Actinomortierella ambigua]